MQALAIAALEETDYKTQSMLQEIAKVVSFSEMPPPLARKLSDSQI